MTTKDTDNKALDTVDAQQQVLPVFSTEIPEDDEISAIGRVKLLSGMSEEVTSGAGRPGEYSHEAFGSLGQMVVLQPIGAARVRKLWDPAGTGILCQSNDMLTGVGEPGGNCQQCPLAERELRSDGTRGASPCKPMTSFAGLLIDYDSRELDDDSGPMPIFIEFGVTAMRVSRRIFQLAQRWEWGKFSVKLGVAQRTSTMGQKYSSPRVISQERLDPADWYEA